ECLFALRIWIALQVGTVIIYCIVYVFFFQAEDGIRDFHVTGVQTCALPICLHEGCHGRLAGCDDLHLGVHGCQPERDAPGSAGCLMATLWNGEQEETLETFLWNGSELYPATDKVFPYGYQTYDDMTSRSMFYVGHRGCSDSRPEMSMRAYTDAAFWGVGALEFWARRTSHGVWFGMHEATRRRSNGVEINPNTLTWEQVQAYQITLGPGAPEPFVRMEDVLDT